jgi:hypothetical protein
MDIALLIVSWNQLVHDDIKAVLQVVTFRPSLFTSYTMHHKLNAMMRRINRYAEEI